MASHIIWDYNSGTALGTAEVDYPRYYKLAQWPEGIIRADRLLGDEGLEALDIARSQVVYIEARVQP